MNKKMRKRRQVEKKVKEKKNNLSLFGWMGHSGIVSLKELHIRTLQGMKTKWRQFLQRIKHYDRNIKIKYSL